MLTSGQVQRTIQKFSDYSRDLLQADYNTFDDRLKVFVHFCETDTVFSRIHAQLQTIKGVDFDAWLAGCQASVRSMVGSGNLDLPIDEEHRMAIIYELLRRANDDRIDLLGFINNFFAISSNRITDHIQAFNDAITAQLIRELGYRLETLAEQLPDNKKDEVPVSMIQIIHQATNVIQQSATGTGNILTATQSFSPEMEQLFRELKAAAIAEPNGIDKSEIEEIIATALLAAKAEQPKPSAMKRLFAALPPTAAVLSITASIMKIFGG